MGAFGHNRPVSVAAQFSMKRTLALGRRKAFADPYRRWLLWAIARCDERVDECIVSGLRTTIDAQQVDGAM
jgi:hypothetical protein